MSSALTSLVSNPSRTFNPAGTPCRSTAPVRRRALLVRAEGTPPASQNQSPSLPVVASPVQKIGNAVKQLMAGKEFLRWYDDNAVEAALPKAEKARQMLAVPLKVPAYLDSQLPNSWSEVANQETSMAQRNLKGLALREEYSLHLGQKHPLVLRRFEPMSNREIKHARHGRAFLVNKLAAALREALGPESAAACRRGGDMGCGTGRTTRLVGKAFGPGLRMTGIDASSHALAWAVTHDTHADKRITFSHGLMEDLPLGPRSQDFATAIWSLEDMPLAAQVKAVDEAIRTLKPGGVLAILSQKPGHKCALDPTEPKVPFEVTLRGCGFKKVTTTEAATGHTITVGRKSL